MNKWMCYGLALVAAGALGYCLHPNATESKGGGPGGPGGEPGGSPPSGAQP